MLLQFIWAFFATVGFTFIFNVPRRHMIPAGLVGASGWLIFQYAVSASQGNVVACFLGSCAVALLSDLCSRLFKEAATLFIIPGILPLVPGAGMYNTMLAFLEKDLEKTASIGYETLLMAGSIAVGLLIVSSLLRIFHVLLRLISSKMPNGISSSE